MERNGIDRAQAAYIGDTMGDCEAARLAGIPFIFASYGFGKVPEAALKITKFSDIFALVEA